MTTMTQKDFAILHGVSKMAVSKWNKRGWLAFEGSLVDVERSNAWLKKYRVGGDNSANQSSKPVNQNDGFANQTVNHDDKATSAVNQLKRHDGESIEAAAERLVGAIDDDMNIDEAKRLKAMYEAKLLRIEYDLEIGKVVLVSDVVRRVGENYATTRTRLLAIPSEQAPRIHAIKTVVGIQDALLEALTDAMQELAGHGLE